MFREVVRRIPERVDLGGIVPLLTIAAAFSLLGFEVTRWDVVGSIVGVVILAPIIGTLLERYEIDLGLLVIAFGLLVGWGGFRHLQDGASWLGWPLLVLGGWLCLDGLYAWKHGDAADRGDDADDESDELSNAEVRRLAKHNRRVVEALRDADRPLTAADLRARTGLEADDLERVLARHDEPGPIDRIGNGYVLEERDAGLVAAVRTAARLLRGRLFRPFRLLRPSG